MQAQGLQKAPSARPLARLMTVARDHLTKADTVTVAGLDRDDVRFGEGELVLSVPAVEAPAGQAVRLVRRRGDPLCPAQALERWLQRSAISYGAVFRAITVHGTLQRRLSMNGLRCILR